MKNKIIILGGSGFLASHLTDLFKKNKVKSLILDKIKKNFFSKHIEFVHGDILDKKKLLKIISPGDVVYHFAAIADIDEANKNHLKSIEVNILGTVNVLEACVKKKAKKLIFSSSIYARSEKGGFYSTTKLACEMLIERYANKFNLKYTIIRFGSLYGEKSNYFNTVKNIITQGLKTNKILRNTMGNEIRDYIHVKDAVEICSQLIKKKYDNKYFTLVGKEKKTVKQIILTIAKELKVKKVIFKKDIKDQDHYVVNPYSYKTRVGKLLKPKKPIKFIEGIRKIIEDERKVLSLKTKQ
tara:strand:- start:1385 stop:2275 length:891 start_codon:yes stop_codon:yes gene_type:complete